MPEEFKTFWDHVADLRKAILLCLLIIFLGAIFCFTFSNEIFHLLTLPLQPSGNKLQENEIKKRKISNPSNDSQIYILRTSEAIVESSEGVTQNNSQVFLPPKAQIVLVQEIPSHALVLFNPIEGMVATIKISLWFGILGTSPFWLFALLKFINPALRPREKNLLAPFLLFSFLFLVGGLLFAYWITIPLANRYFESFNSKIGINMWSLSNYMDYTLLLLFANSVAFEISFLLLFLVHLRVIDADWLISKRRHMIIVAFILGAILTPPDIGTQFLLAIPLIALYELAILYAKVRTRFTTETQRKKRETQF